MLRATGQIKPAATGKGQRLEWNFPPIHDIIMETCAAP